VKAHLRKSRCLEALGDYAGALTALNTARALDRSNEWLHEINPSLQVSSLFFRSHSFPDASCLLIMSPESDRPAQPARPVRHCAASRRRSSPHATAAAASVACIAAASPAVICEPAVCFVCSAAGAGGVSTASCLPGCLVVILLSARVHAFSACSLRFATSLFQRSSATPGLFPPSLASRCFALPSCLEGREREILHAVHHVFLIPVGVSGRATSLRSIPSIASAVSIPVSGKLRLSGRTLHVSPTDTRQPRRMNRRGASGNNECVVS
jgi:hypothetical protein